jgi:hypothetical protein
MATTQDLKWFELFPTAEVWDRKHVFHGTEPSYTIMGACGMPQWYEGNIGLIDPTPYTRSQCKRAARQLTLGFKPAFPSTVVRKVAQSGGLSTQQRSNVPQG